MACHTKELWCLWALWCIVQEKDYVYDLSKKNMAASMDDGDGFQADDLYVLLNVDKKASFKWRFHWFG